MYVNRLNFRILKEIGVEERDGDVRFQTGSGNATISCMRRASGHNYRNSSFIVDVAMGQIPRSTERISSYFVIFSRIYGVKCWNANADQSTLYMVLKFKVDHTYFHRASANFRLSDSLCLQCRW